jgi:hypothetical protein
MAIPTLKEWTTLRDKHKAPDANVTKALNAYWASGANTPKKYMVAYTALEKQLAAYISKLSGSASTKKKITDYPKFEKAFLDKFVGQVHKERVDTERGMATLSTYQAEIAKYMTMVQKLSKTKSTRDDLARFKSGPARGLSAMASRARNLTQEQLTVLNNITEEVKKVDRIVDTMPATMTQTEIGQRVQQIIDLSKEIATLAKNGSIVANK